MNGKRKNMFNFLNKLFNISYWEEISDPPRWVVKKADAYYNRYSEKHGRPYGHVIYFKGKTFIYKVYYKVISVPGPTDQIYYKKLR
jgi:hypothetical protein